MKDIESRKLGISCSSKINSSYKISSARFSSPWLDLKVFLTTGLGSSSTTIRSKILAPTYLDKTFSTLDTTSRPRVFSIDKVEDNLFCL